MSVFLQKQRVTYNFDFWYRGKRYWGNTHQTTLADAKRVESRIREKLRHEAGGIAIFRRCDSPTFRDWANIFLEYKSKKLESTSVKHLVDMLRVALRFWGAADPNMPPATDPSAVFRDLRLCDPIDQPELILEWEAWLTARGIGAQSKNHYRGLMRRMYEVARLPEYRRYTGVQTNPFIGTMNDPTMPRDVTMTVQDLRAWLTHASYHVRLAVAIGALAHKLREKNILELQWSQHFEPDPRQTKFNPRITHYIKVRHHKTVRRVRRPLVVPIAAQLLRVLQDAWRRFPDADYVVTYHGRPVKNITGGAKAAAEAAGLTYGRDVRNADGNPIGLTFHTLRHTATTLMSDLVDSPFDLMDAAGHSDIATTMQYRHTRPRHQKPTLERLSRSVKIEDVVTKPNLMARRHTA